MKWFFVVAISAVAVYLWINSDSFQLKCVISKKDGNTYCVRDTAKLQESADLLAQTTIRMKELVAYMGEKHGNDERVKRLVANFNPQRVTETLPTSEHTAYSENKGEKIAFCLRRDKDKMKLIDLNTLVFVALHELSHLTTTSIGHGDDFWTNFKFILKNAVAIGIYEPVDYAKQPAPYCGMTIDDNPMFTDT
jgi:hypothetical protein